MPANIGYTILECSGEEAENPCTELLAHTQDSKGWTTPRNGTFPQHITLQLDHPARLQQVQLLSHEYKIAGKIELQVGCSTKDKQTQEFSRLGFLSFDPNDRTNFSARELKSVTLPDVEATAVKLIIHRCHTNKMNTHSQACLIMLNLVGEPLVSSVNTTDATTTTATATAAAPVVVVAAPAVPLTINPTITHRVTIEEENVDQVTAQRIAELQEKKAAAVAIEDYDEAKRLKSAIERLRAAGAKMASLEARKKAAVDAEDYDTAKAIKIELEKMRHRAYAAIAKGGDHYDAAGGVDHARILSPVQQQAGAAAALSNDNIMNTSATTATTTASAAAPFSPALSSIDSYDGSRDNAAVLNTTISPMDGSRSAFMQKPTTSGGSSDWRSYDERPARAAGAYDLTNFEDLNADSAPPGAVVRTTTAGRGGIAGGVAGSPGGVNGPLRRIDENADYGGSNHPARALAGAGGEVVETGERAAPEPPCPPAPPGFPSELPLPEPLSPDDAKESGPMESVIGEFLTRCLYSKSWQLREAGIASIATAVGTSSPDALPRLDGDGDALRLLCGVVAQGLKARIPAIVAASLVLLRVLVRSAAARQFPPRDVHAALTELLPLVAERACDTAPRAREQAVEALVDIAKVKESGLKSLTGIFLRSYKVTESPKITQGRLHLLAALLPVLGVVPSNSNTLSLPVTDTNSSPSPSSSTSGFSADAVVLFCCPALKSANAEVRSAAAELVVKVGRAPGVGADVVLPLLPIDANPKLKQQLEEDLTGQKKITTTRGTSTAAATAAAVRPGSTSEANGGKASNTRSKSASTSEPSSRRTTNTTMAGTGGAATNSGGAAGRASNTSAKTGNSNQQERRPSQRSAMPPQQQQAPLQTPNYYQQQQQQALYQPSPSLPPPAAEDPSTIMYTPSVVGPKFSVADEDPAPFEEELRRREATLGPSHPSVAEAASNLAIIYNQRGDGARALPLYQRALNIWEMTHGPHHPDVAHALTDIAVILLEAGHDVQGKQLLQRALGIQMELLGPNHPDVVAIKDVLDED